MVLASALLSLASATTDYAGTVDGKNPTEPSSVATTVDDDMNRNLDIVEFIKEAIRKCQGEIDRARVSDEPGIIQRGLAAEETARLLERLIDLRWSSVLRDEIPVFGEDGLDLRQRMEVSWKNSLIAKMVKAEVHFKRFIEAMVEPTSIPSISKKTIATATHKDEGEMQACTACESASSVERNVKSLVGKPSPIPAKSASWKEPSRQQHVPEPMISHRDIITAAVANTAITTTAATVTTPIALGGAEEDVPLPHDSKEIPDVLSRATHRKLKPPKNGKMIPTTLTDLDVPRGRGGVINRHPGHQYLLSRVCSYRDQYKAAKRGEKESLAKQLVRDVQDRNGRFLDYMIGGDGRKTWYEIDDEAAIKVVQQKLRELPVRVKDKWKSTSDTDEGSGEHEEGDQANNIRNDYLHPATRPSIDCQERKAKGEREAAMVLLSL